MASDTRNATDGRRLRSEASRERIINALIELLGEGDVAPSAEAVADRAGVGLRTVFRHFDNMESLYQQISARMRAEIAPVFARPFVALDWRGRVKEAVERRIDIFEKIMPLKVAADVHRHRSDYLAQQGALMITEQRTALSLVVGDAVGQDDPLFEALDLVLSFEAWRRLRQDQNLTSAKARAVVRHLVEGLLAD